MQRLEGLLRFVLDILDGLHRMANNAMPLGLSP
jgi:hypothetical protein